MQSTVQKHPIPWIVFFDGYCNLCNGFINFCINHDPLQKFSFATLDSQTAIKTIPKAIIEIYKNDPLNGTVVLYMDGKIYDRSEAAFRILYELDSWIRFIVIFRFVPRFITDSIYKWIAKNRYKLFGKSESCKVPSPELKLRFLE